jgi:hypothetical protein
VRRDLLVVVPDKKWEVVIRSILDRPESLGIRPVAASATVATLCTRDSGVRWHGVEFAASLSQIHGWALLVFDHEGCGDEREPAKIEDDLRAQLRRHWADRAEAVVVAPEIEASIWRATPQIAKKLGLSIAQLKARLAALGFWIDGEAKPSRPKEALEVLFRHAQKNPNAAVFAELARATSLRPQGCKTSSFPRFIEILRKWFPARTPS